MLNLETCLLETLLQEVPPEGNDTMCYVCILWRNQGATNTLGGHSQVAIEGQRCLF